MKKLLILSCVCMICFTACTLEENVQSDINNSNKSMETHSQTGLNTGTKGTEIDSNGNTSELDIDEVGKLEKDRIELESKLEQLRNQLGYYQDLVHTSAVDQIVFELGLPLSMEKIESVEEYEIKSVLSELLENGYKLIDRGESYDIKINFEVLMEDSRGIDGPERDYVELNYYFDIFMDRLASKSPVNIDELVSMIIRIEDHLNKWPNSSYNQAMNKLYKNQLMLYYLGNADYPVFDFNSNKLLEERLELMKKHMQLYIESDFAQIGLKYLLALENNEYAYHPEYIQIIDSFKKFGLDSELKLVEKKTLDHSKSVFLPELLGHNNLTIQESINQILRDEVENQMRRTGFSESSDGTFYFNTYIYTANSEYLSIECMGTHNLKDWTLDQSAATTFNFDLGTGEPLTLERLFEQDTVELDKWMLSIVNDEMDKYFGEASRIETLQNVQYLIQDDALLIIGSDPTHRAYIPRWILKDYVDVNKIFQ